MPTPASSSGDRREDCRAAAPGNATGPAFASTMRCRATGSPTPADPCRPHQIALRTSSVTLIGATAVRATSDEKISGYLVVRHVQLRPRRLGRRVVLRVADDADDGEPVGQCRRLDALADRIVARPDGPRERLVHDRDRRRLQIVAVGEIAALQNRDPHRLEVVGRHEVIARLRLRRRARPAGLRRVNAVVAAVAAERHGADQRRRFDARHRAHALDRPR